MVTITISGAEKTGSLARISTLLVRKGYRLGAQQVAESGTGSKLVKISLDVSLVDRAKLASEIRSLNPDFTLVSVESASPQSL
jgi:hypothetical protein